MAVVGSLCQGPLAQGEGEEPDLGLTRQAAGGQQAEKVSHLYQEKTTA